jgi:hypothetical protein
VTHELDSTVFEWEEGYNRLEAARTEPARYRVLGRIVLAVEDQLRRKLGSTFTVAELVDLYRQGTDWCLELGIAAAAEQGGLSDIGAACDAAFYLYMREAADYAGGRVRIA